MLSHGRTFDMTRSEKLILTEFSSAERAKTPICPLDEFKAWMAN
jgi:hypothetical protein